MVCSEASNTIFDGVQIEGQLLDLQCDEHLEWLTKSTPELKKREYERKLGWIGRRKEVL